jgi:hypothetical protein
LLFRHNGRQRGQAEKPDRSINKIFFHYPPKLKKPVMVAEPARRT